MAVNEASVIYSPFTDEQVANLNRWQFGGLPVHQYTCGLDSSHVLVATTSGWICSHYSDCSYRQYWALNIKAKDMDAIFYDSSR